MRARDQRPNGVEVGRRPGPDSHAVHPSRRCPAPPKIHSKCIRHDRRCWMNQSQISVMGGEGDSEAAQLKGSFSHSSGVHQHPGQRRPLSWVFLAPKRMREVSHQLWRSRWQSASVEVYRDSKEVASPRFAQSMARADGSVVREEDGGRAGTDHRSGPAHR